MSLLGLGPLGSVLGTALHTAIDTLGVQSTTDDVVTHTGKVLHTAATDQYYAMLLQVVADTRNVRGYLDTIRELNTGYLTQSRVRLFGGHGTNSGANTTLLGAVGIAVGLVQRVVSLLQSRGGRLADRHLTAFAYTRVGIVISFLQ